MDGNDLLAVYQITRELVSRARAGKGVSLLEVVTYRRKGHAEHDDQRYQPAEEISKWEEKDPIDLYVGRLLREGWVEAAELEEVDQAVATELTEAVSQCEHDPDPEGRSALPRVYLDPATAELLWFRRLNA